MKINAIARNYSEEYKVEYKGTAYTITVWLDPAKPHKWLDWYIIEDETYREIEPALCKEIMDTLEKLV